MDMVPFNIRVILIRGMKDNFGIIKDMEQVSYFFPLKTITIIKDNLNIINHMVKEF
jgi:hypothetical protein